jgi:hypothetical protein
MLHESPMSFLSDTFEQIVAEIGKRMAFVGNAFLLTIAQFSNSNHHQALSESPNKPYRGHDRITSLLSEAQHRIVQVVFCGAPSGYELSEAPSPCPSVSRSRPNCSKDLPEIREESVSNTTSIGYVTSISGPSSTDPVSPPQHVVCYHFQLGICGNV